MYKPDAEDVQDNSYYSQSSTNASEPVVDHFQQPENIITTTSIRIR